MIDREGPVPPYLQLAAILRKKIESGEIPPGRAIPSLTALEAEYELARDTIRKAIKVLRDEGLVETVVGMGIFVKGVDKDLVLWSRCSSASTPKEHASDQWVRSADRRMNPRRGSPRRPAPGQRPAGP
jgi:GntR family transcriptional regulator